MTRRAYHRPGLLPLPTPERRAIVQHLSMVSSALDADAADRSAGGWDGAVSLELRKASGSLRLVAAMVVIGAMSTRRARFWAEAASDYLDLVKRADRAGIIR